MTDSLVEMFEQAGGVRIDRDGKGRTKKDLYGARFENIEKAIRAVATVGVYVGQDIVSANLRHNAVESLTASNRDDELSFLQVQSLGIEVVIF